MRLESRPVLAALLLLALVPPLEAAERDRARVRSLRIVLLSTMLADEGIGEWGFAALVEADGRRLLFDTGARPRTVLDNARELGIELGDVEEVVLSHNHSDHTGGLLTLRRELSAGGKPALGRAHVARGTFWSRPGAKGEETNNALKIRSAYEAAGGSFVVHEGPAELLPGVWLTGPVPRLHPERNWSAVGRVLSPAGAVEDTIPEDQSLVFDTHPGLVLLSGCGHAGVVNTAVYARKVVREAPLHALVGGLHLFPLDDERLDWTAARLREMGAQSLLGAHCTGLEPEPLEAARQQLDLISEQWTRRLEALERHLDSMPEAGQRRRGRGKGPAPG
jgi:7,8-dihydropterin-6-yl-methyl-4-(beta-D-ribofuranosyl)aminobenzene 5'-phosphate synthase